MDPSLSETPISERAPSFPPVKNLLAVTEVPVRPKKLPLKSQRGPTFNTYNKTMDPQGHSTLNTKLLCTD